MSPRPVATALFLMATAAPALAGFTLEIDPRTESFASRAACEQALEIRHSAALARFAALPAKERRSGRVEALTPELAERAGELLASTAGANAVDATVVASAALRGDLVITGDEHDLRELADLVSGVTVEHLR